MKLVAWLARNWWRVAIGVAYDVYDFTIGRIPVLGSFTDTAAAFLSLVLWGVKSPTSYIQALEVLDVTDQLDAQLPSMTLTAAWRLYADVYA